MTNRFKLLFTALFLFIFTVACSNNSDTTKEASPKSVDLTVSAAVSLQNALTELQSIYEKDHSNVKVKFNFGASGALQQQIAQGAPVDLFFSAAEDKFDALVKDGVIAKSDGVDLLGNELVLIVPKDSNSSVKNFADLTTKEIKKISIGTPESVPAGQYAKESFRKTNIWNKIEPKVVYAKDVRQVLSYVETGNVDAGVVYKTDALFSDKVNIVAQVDKETHTPIVYPAGVIKDTKHPEEAQQFYKFLQSEQAMRIFENYGFTSN